jgi:hypothetical protein
MSEVKKCPKCGKKMRTGKLLARYSPIKHFDLVFEDAKQQKLLTEKKWVVAYEWKRRGSPSWIPSKLAQFVMGSLRMATPKLAEVWFGIR